ncbi:MAG: DUF2867 domain-containing protein [Melioribacteraceae bacterium]|nr:DUF2867 domain-containing protein [Melioribacteraceae bacterium]
MSNVVLSNIDYKDAYKAVLSDTNSSIEDIYIGIFAHSPKWINSLLALRNKIVGVFGLDNNKGATKITKENVRVGSKVGLFKIYEITENEIIAGEDDDHLNFRVSVLKQNNEVTVTTVVQYNNIFGKIYMIAVLPFHKIIVKSILKNAVKNKRI